MEPVADALLRGILQLSIMVLGERLEGDWNVLRVMCLPGIRLINLYIYTAQAVHANGETRGALSNAKTSAKKSQKPSYPAKSSTLAAG